MKQKIIFTCLSFLTFSFLIGIYLDADRRWEDQGFLNFKYPDKTNVHEQYMHDISGWPTGTRWYHDNTDIKLTKMELRERKMSTDKGLHLYLAIITVCPFIVLSILGALGHIEVTKGKCDDPEYRTL